MKKSKSFDLDFLPSPRGAEVRRARGRETACARRAEGVAAGHGAGKSKLLRTRLEPK